MEKERERSLSRVRCNLLFWLSHLASIVMDKRNESLSKWLDTNRGKIQNIRIEGKAT